MSMDLARDGNLIEAGIWFVCGLVLTAYALRRDGSAARCGSSQSC